jgi:hypothetical protein
MQDEDILDKKILQLTNNGANYYNDKKNDFYIDIVEPIKNVTHIKILKSSVRLNLTSLNSSPVIDNDPIYISINDYNRINTFEAKTEVIIKNSSNITSNYVTNVFQSFEVINLNVTSKYLIMANSQISNFLQINGILFENIYTSTSASLNDTNVYNIIPHEPSLKRFNIKLYDKNYDLIDKDDIKNFEILICVFSNNKKVTMR